MDAREIRIGNLVMASVFGGKGESVWVHLEGEVHTAGKDVIKLGDGVTFPIESLSAIPLTEEWLLKLGFTCSSSGKFKEIKLNTNSSLFKMKEDDYITMEIGGDMPDETELKHIKHVHQLQNLYFALCGEELTVKS